MHMLLCVCPPRMESLSPSHVEVLQSNPTSLQSWFSRNSSSHCQTPRLGSLTWGSELPLQWVDFCDISVLHFVSHPPSSFGIWFYCDCAPLLPSHCGLSFVFGCGVSFLVSSSVFLLMTVQQLVVILVLLQEGVSTRPPTPPSWTNPTRWHLNRQGFIYGNIKSHEWPWVTMKFPKPPFSCS